MQYPKLRALPSRTQMIDTFRGYNHNLRIADGEFYDMCNLTGDHFPVIAARKPRGTFGTDQARALIDKDGLCYVCGGDFVMGTGRVAMGLSQEPKQLVSMGACVIILPDRKWVNTVDGTFGDIEASFVSAGEVTFSLCRADGSLYTEISGTRPEITDDMESGKAEAPVWLDTSSTPHSLKQYSPATGLWSTVATTYIRVSAPGIGRDFAVNDAVSLSGVADEALSMLNGSVIIRDRGEDYIVLTGLVDQLTTQTTPVTLSRTMPEMDFVIESENRLWGCRYGKSEDGQTVNEIYASALGDFKNWKRYMGLSTDSYAVSVGTDGPFTGAVTYLGYPTFFKENAIHTVYGSSPSKYQMQTTVCPGVQRGCHGSLAIVGDILLYKGRQSVMAYNGAMPNGISDALGTKRYDSAVAAGFGDRYYLSMTDPDDGQRVLFVYDIRRGMWYRESGLGASAMCASKDEVYFIGTDGKIGTVLGSGSAAEKKVRWMAQTGIMGAELAGCKYLSRLLVRMLLPMGSQARFRVEYDSSGVWEKLCSITGRNLRSFGIPVRLRRCDHLRLRIDGEGDARIYSITKTIEEGSDRV